VDRGADDAIESGVFAFSDQPRYTTLASEARAFAAAPQRASPRIEEHMSSETASAETVHDPVAPGRSRRPDAFFFVMTVLLMAIVLVAFAPTLYLRAFTNALPLPAHLHVHGIVLTGWFVWLLVQAALIRSGNVRRHRQLGFAGVALGLAVIVAGPLATFNVVPEIRAAGFELDWDVGVLGTKGLGAGVSIAAFLSSVVWANLASIATFFALVMAAILLRSYSDAHKRLMLLASISIVGPALARVSRWPPFGGEQGPFVASALLTLLAAVVIHDLVVSRRIHLATLIGGTFAVLMAWAGASIATSEFGENAVRSM
jgi:hypothetical protein